MGRIETNQLSIDEIRTSQLEMMDYLDKVCRENQIEYSLAFGTLIGAARHKGFIPWDDDLDIFIFREDYERFRTIIKNDESFPYRILDENNAFFVWTKICDKRTYVKEKVDYRIPDYGVWIDIFPYDSLPDWRSFRGKLFRKRLDIYWKLANYRARTFSSLRINNIQDIFKTIVKVLIQPFSINFWGKQWCRYVQKYSGERTGYRGFPCVYSAKNQTIDENIFKEYIDIDFENHVYRAIKAYDVYLNTIYGDYMELPPENERVYKHAYEAFWA